MAVSVTAINAITKQLFIPKLVDNVFTSNALLYFMEKNKGFETVDGGQDIRQPVRYARFSSRGFYSGAETLNTAYNEKKTALTKLALSKPTLIDMEVRQDDMGQAKAA